MTTSSSNPIFRKEELPPWWMFWKRPALIRNMAMVLVRNGQAEKALLATDQSEWSQLIWSRYQSIYWVDMNGRSFLLEATLPTKHLGLDFRATVYVAYKVDDPLVILNSRVTNPQATIEEQATAIMRETSRKHPIVEIGAAEKSIQQALSTHIQVGGITITRCFVTLDAGDEERDHARKVRALERKYLYSLQDAAYTKQINEVDSDIGQNMTTFYNNLSQPGYAQFLLLHLSRNPDQIQAILEALNRQRKHERDHWIHMLDVLRDNGALEPFNLETLRKSVIDRLAEVDSSGFATIGAVKNGAASKPNSAEDGNGAPLRTKGLVSAASAGDAAKGGVGQAAAPNMSTVVDPSSVTPPVSSGKISTGTTMIAAIQDVTPAGAPKASAAVDIAAEWEHKATALVGQLATVADTADKSGDAMREAENFGVDAKAANVATDDSAADTQAASSLVSNATDLTAMSDQELPTEREVGDRL